MALRTLILAATVALGAFATNPAQTHDGKLDDNGCHYERGRGGYHCHEKRAPNPDKFATVKKTRENICLDKRSASYKMTIHFVAYQTMRQCVMSGGNEAIDDGGGLINRP